MKQWTVDQARSDAAVPEDVVAIIDLLEAEFAERGEDRPRLVSVGTQEDMGDDCWRYETLTELAPGVLLPTETGYAELIDTWSEEEPDNFDVAAAVLEGVDACSGEAFVAIAETLHQGRMRVRSILAGWQSEGIVARLHDVRLAPYDHWRGASSPVLQVLVETLDERLEPAVETISAESLEAIATELDEAKAHLSFRMGRRAELAAKGATGCIDRLALNALATTGDTAAQLRRFGSEWRFWLPDQTALVMRDGRVSAGSGLADPEIDWSHGQIVVRSSLTDQARLKQAVGRPVTELLPHSYHSDDIIVREARSVEEEGRLFVVIEIDMPVLLFCSTTGRVWEDVTPTSGASATPNTSTVVPFKRRA